MPGGEQWYLVKAPSDSYARTVEVGIRGITERIDVLDAFALVKQLAGLVRKPVGIYPEEIEKLL